MTLGYTLVMLIRIEKYLSEQGIMSRREAKKYLLEGFIKVMESFQNLAIKLILKKMLFLIVKISQKK